MADTESLLDAGRRLARDLRSIRRSRSIDMKDVLDATRLAEDVIEQLEDTALLGNPMFNRVYLRSMFGSYATVLGISHTDMMASLDEALSGNYVGSLAKKYLVSRTEEENIPAADTLTIESAIDLPTTPVPYTSGSTTATSNQEKKQEERKLKKSKGEKGSPNSLFLPTENAENGNSSELSSTGSEDLDQEGIQQVPPANEPKRRLMKKSPEPAHVVFSGAKANKSTVLLPNMSGFLMLVVAGLVLVALLWFAISWMLSPKQPLDEKIEVQTPLVQAGVNPTDRVVLPDTIQIELIAYMEALDPIRVQIDRDLRRPYWIEHLDTMSFEMNERVEFEREADHARILISGFAIPSAWYASSIRAEITRDQTQTWLDSLIQAGQYPPRNFGVE